jgi:hypothetical protein
MTPSRSSHYVGDVTAKDWHIKCFSVTEKREERVKINNEREVGCDGLDEIKLA